VNRILIVRLSALGDIIHALPVLFAIKRELPSVSVDWLVEDSYASVLALVPELDRRIIVRAKSPGGVDEAIRFGGGGLGYLRAVSFLRAQRYDAALDLQGLIKSAVWARLSGAKRVIGFKRGYLREPQAVRFYSETVMPPQSGHVIDKNLSVLSALNVPDSPMTIRLQAAAAPDVVAAIAAAGGPCKFIVLNPGAAWPNKRWPADRFGAVAAALFRRTRLRSLITWGPSERELAESVVASSGGAAKLAPATSVADLAVLLRDAAVVVSGDTGPLHIAAAMGTPLVGLYGPTWPERNGPWDPRDYVLSRADTCVCHHKRQCLRGAPCINEIGIDQVVAAAERRIRR
jgi:lipopolysaccharide heptosyltransferase I